MITAKVLLVDDHDIVRAGFKQLLDSHANIEIVAQANNSHDAFEFYKTVLPDVVIMDLSMPNSSENQDVASAQGGTQAVQRIMDFDSAAKIIVLTVWESSPYPSNLVKAGVKGYLTKRCAPEELVQAVLTVYQGGKHFSENIKALINGDDDISPVEILTKRELEIFTLLAEGQRSTQIAEDIFLSNKTVHAHRSNIMRKLSLANNAELVHLAIRHGVVRP
ncbi:response regulator transcription factor [Neptunomonas antarctica]|uniref:Two component transcriptional regulator, LuxR family n=1 Tax=Neptunomonas antarctica TaxID=619304 RepID=A0A1N7LK60_9GAMM|nr:response regulator transcription factor [Neptunomonas antarctica]SIS74225.1 two component transcriptional regulator, LuxR family [Neptunomonas antarctica]